MTMALRRYTFKLYPNKAQETALREQARLCAVLWNALLQMREDHYRRAKLRGEKKTSLTAFDQGKDITALNQAAKLDLDLAEWRAVPRGTQERVADMLDLAMKAFFKRAKGGAGASSGYPRYKSTMRAENIPLREPSKSCWKFAAHSGPARESEPNGGGESSRARGEEGSQVPIGTRDQTSFRARGEEGKHGGSHASPSPSSRARGEDFEDNFSTGFKPKGEIGGCHSGAFSEKGKRKIHSVSGDKRISVAAPLKTEGGDRSELYDLEREQVAATLKTDGGDRHVNAARLGAAVAATLKTNGGDRVQLRGYQWRLTLRGIPGAIKARGKFPVEPLAHKTADIKFHDGAWWFSICVEMPERRAAGAENLKVELDLIDSFAAVTADGQCVPGLNDPFSKGRKSEIPKHDEGLQAICCGDPANVGDAQVCFRPQPRRCGCGDPANVGDAQGIMAQTTDLIQSARDRRYKRGSIRWRREKQRVARIKARKARQTKEALHRWTAAIVSRAKELHVIAPPVKQMTKTGRGNEQFPGAEVATVAMLNRHVLAMAPASAVQMLEYKAAEAGIACNVERREDHQIRIGGDLRAAAVANKRARRITKRNEKKAA